MQYRGFVLKSFTPLLWRSEGGVLSVWSTLQEITPLHPCPVESSEVQHCKQDRWKEQTASLRPFAQRWRRTLERKDLTHDVHRRKKYQEIPDILSLEQSGFKIYCHVTVRTKYFINKKYKKVSEILCQAPKKKAQVSSCSTPKLIILLSQHISNCCSSLINLPRNTTFNLFMNF